MTWTIGQVTDRIGHMKSVRLRPQVTLFGTATRTSILTALADLDESYPRELARLLNVSLSSVQAAVEALEREGVVVTRRLGTERRVRLNSRYFCFNELKSLLYKLSDAQPELMESLRSVRRRPRRRGKPL